MAESDAGERVRELVAFALEKLPSMRLDDGVFCYEVEAPGLQPTGRSLRYTLICLLGLQRAKAAGLEVPIEPDEIRDTVMDRIDDPEMTAGDLALLLWADSRSEQDRHGRDRLPPAQEGWGPTCPIWRGWSSAGSSSARPRRGRTSSATAR